MVKNRKKDLIRFLIWFRNGFAFLTTWFLLLVLIFCYAAHITSISIISLIKMLIWIAGCVLIFDVFFSGVIIKKMNFERRLTFFMIVIAQYQLFGIDWFDFLSAFCGYRQWILFIAVIGVLYLCCIGIYRRYSKKKGKLYTQALKKYQQKRSNEHE